MNTQHNKSLIIIGAGSLGVMTLDVVLKSYAFQDIYFVDDYKKQNTDVYGIEVIGGLSILEEINLDSTRFVIAIADNQVRAKIAKRFAYLPYVNIIHPNVSISSFAQIKGSGNIILSHTSIDPKVFIHSHVIINKNCSIGHDTVLHNYSQVSPGCSFGGYTTLEEEVFVGIGANTLPNVTI